MPSARAAIDAAIEEVTNARNRVARLKTAQVRRIDDTASLRSTAHAWFETHRRIVADAAPSVDLSDADRYYKTVLEAAAKHTAKTKYLQALKMAKESLVVVQTELLVPLGPATNSIIDDRPPDFSVLAGNQEMRDILTRRWVECQKCVQAEAHLAAIVMMGGLLEALFVARANKLSDKRPLVNAAAAPKDKATGKTKELRDWMLDSYIKVGFELHWITEAAKYVADVLKEYRNYVHPEKERRHGVVLAYNDSAIFWAVTKELVRQLLMTAQSA